MSSQAPALLGTQAAGPTALSRLAEQYFRDIQTCGRLAGLQSLYGRPVSTAQLAAATLRGTWVANFLQTLEAHAGLRFAQLPVTYCSVGQSWEPSVPPAGATDRLPAPLPSQVVLALCGSWNLSGAGARRTVHAGHDAVTTGLPPSATPQFLCGALWICRSAGLPAAIDFLFQLQEAGYFADCTQLVDLIDLLLAARCQVGSDEELIDRFFRGHPPDDPADWRRATITLDWITVTGLSSRWHMPRFTFDALRFAGTAEPVQDVLGGLVEKAVSAIERVRNAATWDDWLVEQVSLGVRLEVTLHVLSSLEPKPSLMLRSILSQFQEVRADVNGLCAGLWLDPNVPSFLYGPPAQLFARLAAQYRTTIGDGWQNRLFTERLIVPASLRPLMLDRTTDTIPPAWDGLSWRLAHPVSMTIQPQTVAAWRRQESETALSIETMALPLTPIWLNRVAFQLEPLVDVPAIRQAFEQYGVAERATQQVYLSRVFGSVSGPAVPTDIASEASYALAMGVEAATSGVNTFEGLDPDVVTSVDRTMVRYEIVQRLLSIRRTLCDLDTTRVMNTSAELLQQGKVDEALTLLTSSLDIFPWHNGIYQQRAVALNVLGKHEEAIEDLLAALLLDFNNAAQWQLLGATLQALGDKDEAVLALTLGALMGEKGFSYRDA